MNTSNNITLKYQTGNPTPAPFPKPVEVGGGGNCAIFSLLHQTSQIKGLDWKVISREEQLNQVQKLRHICCLYMQTHSQILAQDNGFWNDLMSDWDTVLKEEQKGMMKSINPNKLEIFRNNFCPYTTLEEAKLILIATFDNWKQNLPSDVHQANEIKAKIIEIFAEYIERKNVQLDSAFWNIYTKLANDNSFVNTCLEKFEFPIKQILLMTKVDKTYQTLGIWPKHLDETTLNIEPCGFIYYNGSTHYQSFDRNQIVDYLTSQKKFTL